MTIDRRTFLKTGLALPAAAALPSIFARALFAAEPSDEVLVLVQLAGGNDGLNTVIPFQDDAYHRARPGIGIPAGQVVRLRDGIGLHPSLAPLRAAWDQGDLGVLQGVGYPNPNRSHFTSTDIWQTAYRETPDRWSGWLGRALDRSDTGEVPGLQLHPGPLSLALVGERVVVPSVSDASRFRVMGGAGARRRLEALCADGGGEGALRHVRRSALSAYRTAGALERALEGGRGKGRYPGTDLGRRLWQIARCIEAGLPARVYAVALGGFDTHARQRPGHDTLLRVLADALGAFYGDLRRTGLQERVLTVTYSEFGRRVKENRSLGTDHGAAAPMLVLGGRVRGGIHGAHPSLTDLQDGDLRHHTDFRRVYATILERWLRVDSGPVLGARYAPVSFL